MSYLFCKICGKYYELQEGDSSENSNKKCECGFGLILAESDNDFIDIINNIRNQLTKHNQNDITGQIDLSNEVFSIVQNLSKKTRNYIETKLILDKMNLGMLYFRSGQFENVILHLEEVKNRADYDEIDFIDRCHLERAIAYAKIQLGLKNNSKKVLDEAKLMNDLLMEKIDKINFSPLIDEINLNKSILENIDQGNIKTILGFEIPFPVYIKDNYPINFKINGIKHILEFKTVLNPSRIVDGLGEGHLELLEDKHGHVHKTNITLTICRYINPQNIVGKYDFSEEKNCEFEVLSEGIAALNYFLRIYRVVSGNYWIENIHKKTISLFSSKVMVGGHVIRDIPFNMNQLIRYSPEIPRLNDSELDYLNKSLKQNEIALWEILLLDAKDFFIRKNYRESIYAINGAFENFLMVRAREKLKKSWDEKEINDFLEGIPIYKYHDLKGYIAEELFYKAVSDGKIKNYVPPTNRIVKECNRADPSEISRTQLENLVKIIRKKRNLVMHGAEITENLEEIAFNAIKSFERFVEVF